MKSGMGWEHFHHQADIGIRGWGTSLEQAFKQAATAMINVITPLVVRPEQGRIISCQADNPEDLFYDWLNTLVFHIERYRILYGMYEIQIDDNRLQAVIWGEPIDPARHQPAVGIKAATYTELKVTQDPQGLWLAQTVIDV